MRAPQKVLCVRIPVRLHHRPQSQNGKHPRRGGVKFPVMEPIRFNADVQIRAAAKGPPRVHVLAYGGGTMTVPGFGAVVIDLTGLELPASVTLLADHQSNLTGVVGSGKPRIDGGKLFVEGTLAPSSEAAKQIIDLAKAGIEFQASVGVAPLKRSQVKSASVNGRNIVSDLPFNLISKSRLREVSITALGADHSTAVQIAAKAKQMFGLRKKAATPAVEEIVEERDGDVERIEGIARICASYRNQNPGAGDRLDSIESQAIENDWDLKQVALEAMRAARPQAASTSSTRRSARYERPQDLLCAALMLHGNRDELAEKTFGERVTQSAEDLRASSLVELCGIALRLDHREVPASRDEMIRAAFSTSSLPVALSSYGEKSAAMAFAETPGVWDVLCKIVPVTSFHEHKISRVLLTGNLANLPGGGMIEHGARAEDYKTVQAETKALQISIDRRDILNDDIGSFDQAASQLGEAAKRTANDDFANLILANAGSFFGSGNGNLSEAGSELSATNLASAISSMGMRTDTEGRIVDVRPAFLLVPSQLEFLADQLLQSTELQRAVTSSDQQPSGNPLQNRLTRLTEPRLGAAGYSGSSATAWYLFAPSARGAAYVALLNGKKTPTIEQESAPFDVLGLRWRCWFDFGFSLAEHVACHKSTGEPDES